MISNAQLASNLAQDIFCNKEMDRDTIDFNMLAIVDYLKPYIQAEQAEDDAIMAQNVISAESLKSRWNTKSLRGFFMRGEDMDNYNPDSEPGLAGHEMTAFEKTKIEETLGEDPGTVI